MLQGHPYWNGAGFYKEAIDWELVDKRKMASPLCETAQHLVNSFFKLRRRRRVAMTIDAG